MSNSIFKLLTSMLYQQPTVQTQMPLTLELMEPEQNDVTISLEVLNPIEDNNYDGLMYRLNNAGAWQKYDLGTPIQLGSSTYAYEYDDAGNIIKIISGTYSVQFMSTTQSGGLHFTFNQNSEKYGTIINLKGDIQSLFNYSDTCPSEGCAYLFNEAYSNSNIEFSTAQLKLSAINVGECAYFYMFSLCKIIDKTPDLPALFPGTCAYYSMYMYSSIYQPGDIYAQVLSDYCCAYMYSSSTIHTGDMKIHAHTVLDYACYSMFSCLTYHDSNGELLIEPLIEELSATTLGNYCYCSMFAANELQGQAGGETDWQSSYNSYSIVIPPRLPATELANGCYARMFAGCDNLIYSPQLPATYVPDYAYSGMFQCCPQLTNIGTIHAIQISQYGCDYMFSLNMLIQMQQLPQINALNTFTDNLAIVGDYALCYMFYNRQNLKNAPKINAHTIGEGACTYMFAQCFELEVAPELPATTLASYCYNYMFSDCWKLRTAPSILPATELAYGCYSYMFNYCDLIIAPELPATKLVQGCYSHMFAYCKNLNYIKVGFTNWSYDPQNSPQDYSATYNWFYADYYDDEVPVVGTFVKPVALALPEQFNESTIPAGWTVQTY